jgi:1-acyl-sn-glycerol-3-phosphate acyltransferase
MVLPERLRYQNRFLFWGINCFYWIVIKASFVPISFEGVENVPQEPVIFVANHQSSLDIPLAAHVVHGKPHIWVARHELMEWKFLRWVLPRVAMIVNTSSKEKAMRSLIKLIRLVDGKNIDIMIFPEGGRFPDDKVHPFFGGFVTLSKMLQRKVIPIYIDGANKVYPPNTFWVQYHPIKVMVGKPFMIEPEETDEAFKQRVYQWFIEQSKGR